MFYSRTLVPVIFLLTVVASPVFAERPSSWQVEVVDSEGYTGLYNSIAVDRQGYAHIAYRQVLPEEILKYAHWNGTGWTRSNVDTGPGAGQWSSIAVDSQNRPHIAYRMLEDQRLDQLRYARWNGTGWEVFMLESNVGTLIQATSITIDDHDLAHIAYIQIGPTIGPRYPPLIVAKVKYAHPLNPRAWTIGLVESREWVPGSIFSLSLSLDGQGRPHLAYPMYTLVVDNSIFFRVDLRYTRLVNNIWARSTVESYDWDAPCSAIAMAIGNNGTVNVAYRSESFIRSAKLLSFEHNSSGVFATWDRSLVGRVFAPITDLSIGSESEGRLHLFYGDFLASKFTLWHAVWLDHRWARTMVDAIPTVPEAIGLPVDAGLAVQPGASPQVSYYDPVNVDLKYAIAP